LNVGLAAQYNKFSISKGAVLDPLISIPDPLLFAAADGLNFFNTSLGVLRRAKWPIQIWSVRG
jgi:hypothetical protein